MDSNIPYSKEELVQKVRRAEKRRNEFAGHYKWAIYRYGWLLLMGAALMFAIATLEWRQDQLEATGLLEGWHDFATGVFSALGVLFIALWWSNRGHYGVADALEYEELPDDEQEDE